jgi:hypothetical protein
MRNIFLNGADREPDLRDLIYLLHKVLQNQEIILAQIDDLKAAVANDTTVEQSAITLLQGLSTQLSAALAGANSSADVQAVIDSINANASTLAAAVAANTPASVPATPAPSAS